MRVLLQFPEGLKRKAQEYADSLSSKGHEVFLSGSASYGACDVALDEARKVGAKKIVHFGHAEFPIAKEHLKGLKLEFVEYGIDADLEKLRASIAGGGIPEKRIAVATTVQHIHQLPEMKRILVKCGKKPLVGKGAFAKHPGQVLGCDAGAVKVKGAEAVLFIGEGNFHAFAISESDKPVYVFSPYSGEFRKINAEIDALKRRRRGMLAKALSSTVFGILVSTKPGQFRLKLAERIKKELEKKGKKAYIIIASELEPRSISNFTFFDCFITTACPRLSEDSEEWGKPVLDLESCSELIGLL
ncbi:MAG: diphthamide biosynthesis enzyme Dph2 [Candidatus Bilamarchaeaceae archaeon]